MIFAKHITGILLAAVAIGAAVPVSAEFDPQAARSSWAEHGPANCAHLGSDPLYIPRLPQPEGLATEMALPDSSDGSAPVPPRPPYFDDPTVLPWQQSPVTAVAYSPDDRHIVTGSADGLLQLWTKDAEPVGFPFGTGEAAHIELVGFSADGRTIIAGDRRGWLRQWDRSGRLLSEVDTQAHEYAAIAWDQSPDRTQIGVGSLRGDVQVWDVSASHSQLMARTDLGDSPYAIAFSPTSNGLIGDIAVGMRQGDVRFLTPQLTPSREDLHIVAETVTGLSWYPGTRILAVRDSQGVIRVVDATDRPFTPALTDMSRSSGRPPFGYSPTGLLISFASAIDWRLDPVLTGWNLQQRVMNEPIQRSAPSAFGFDSAGTLAVGNSDCTVRLWNRDLQPVTLPFSPTEDEVASVGIAGYDNNRFIQWSIVTDPNRRGPFGTPLPSTYLINQWTPEGTLLSTASLAHTWSIQDAAFDMATQQFVTLGSYGTVARWGFDGTRLGEFKVEGQTEAMALHPEGGVIAIAADDDVPTVQLWSLEGRYLRTLLTLDNSDRLKTLAFDPRGEMVAVGIDDATSGWEEKLLLLSLEGEQIVPPIDLNQAGHYTLTFSPDGSLMAAGDSDGVISIWARTGTRISEVSLFDEATDNGPRIFSLAFSPDNRLLASLDSDEAVRLWQVDGTYLGSLWPDNNTEPSDIRFTLDGQALLIGSAQGIHRWWLPQTLTATRRYPVPPNQPLQLNSPFSPQPLDAGNPLDSITERATPEPFPEPLNDNYLPPLD